MKDICKVCIELAKIEMEEHIESGCYWILAFHSGKTKEENKIMGNYYFTRVPRPTSRLLLLCYLLDTTELQQQNALIQQCNRRCFGQITSNTYIDVYICIYVNPPCDSFILFFFQFISNIHLYFLNWLYTRSKMSHTNSKLISLILVSGSPPHIVIFF